MINVILANTTSFNKRSIINWNRVLNTIEMRTNILSSRFLLSAPVYSPCVNLLATVLNNIDVEYLITQKSDFTRYTRFVASIADSFGVMLDPVYTSTVSKNFFTDSPREIANYLISVNSGDPLRTFPMDKPWEYWKPLKPSRIIYFDSLSLPTNIEKYQVKFTNDIPTRFITSLNTELLVMKYSKYYETFSPENRGPYLAYTFIRDHVLVHWYEDLRRIWIINLLNAMLNDRFSIDQINIDGMVTNNAAIQSVLPDIHKLIVDMKNKNISLSDFLGTDWFGNSSIIDWMNTLQYEIRIPEFRQYAYLRFMTELPIVNLAIKANNIRGGHESTKLNNYIEITLDRYSKANIYNNITDSRLRIKLMEEVSNTLALIKQHSFLV